MEHKWTHLEKRCGLEWRWEFHEMRWLEMRGILIYPPSPNLGNFFTSCSHFGREPWEKKNPVRIIESNHQTELESSELTHPIMRTACGLPESAHMQHCDSFAVNGMNQTFCRCRHALGLHQQDVRAVLRESRISLLKHTSFWRQRTLPQVGR